MLETIQADPHGEYSLIYLLKFFQDALKITPNLNNFHVFSGSGGVFSWTRVQKNPYTSSSG